jgi:hypothetical protein
MASPAWIHSARKELKSLQIANGGWSYREGNDGATEPSALAGLALLASRAADEKSATEKLTDRESLESLADWLDSLRNGDGSYPVRAGVSDPKWPTTLVVLLKIAMARRAVDVQNRVDDEIENPAIENPAIENPAIENPAIENLAIENLAVENLAAEPTTSLKPTIGWLLRRTGRTSKRKSSIVGHDGSIPGWPWIHDTHAWVEPTAWALIALQKLGLDEPLLRERIVQGRRLLHDRMIKSGGWNYGNNKMFGVQLRPRTAPTGLALLALASNPIWMAETASDLAEKSATESVAKSLDYLEREVKTIRSPQSLCWGLLGLAAHGRIPDYAELALWESYERTTGRADASIQLSYLLLAAENSGLKFFQPVAATDQLTEPVTS